MSGVETRSPRRRVSEPVAWALWLFLGLLGLHRLYIGHRVYGLAIAGANILLFATIHVYWLPFALAWWVLDGILLFIWFRSRPPRPDEP